MRRQQPVVYSSLWPSLKKGVVPAQCQALYFTLSIMEQQEGCNGLRPVHSLRFTHTFLKANKFKASVPQTPQLFTK